VEWRTIRTAFVKARGEKTPTAVARDAGMHQSAIQKLEDNDGLGPQVETFVRALKGIGKTPAQFFSELEAPRSHPVTGSGNTQRQSEALPDAAVTLEGLVVPPGKIADPALLEGLGFAFLRASKALRTEGAIRLADEEPATGRAHRPGVERKDSPDVRRLKGK
jgi:hypothetical protein